MMGLVSRPVVGIGFMSLLSGAWALATSAQDWPCVWAGSGHVERTEWLRTTPQ